jgi:hypothetical protein
MECLRAGLHRRPATSVDVIDKYYHRNKWEQVNQTTANVDDQPQELQNNKYDKDCPKHRH